MSDLFLNVVFSLIISFIVFLIFRPVVLWYWRVYDALREMEEANKRLKIINVNLMSIIHELKVLNGTVPSKDVSENPVNSSECPNNSFESPKNPHENSSSNVSNSDGNMEVCSKYDDSINVGWLKKQLKN